MSTRENPIDLTSSDDEEDCKKKRKEPEVTEKIEKKRAKKAVNKCFSCEEPKKDLRATGNSLKFVCEDCIEEIPEMGFCNGCNRYEETDGENFCGTCQYELQKRSERAYARRIGAKKDADDEYSSSNETELDDSDNDDN
jgi:hypothetical protein